MMQSSWQAGGGGSTVVPQAAAARAMHTLHRGNAVRVAIQGHETDQESRSVVTEPAASVNA